MRLLRLISWPYMRRHALRTFLTTMGVVLGIAVFVAMHTANQRVVAAFSDTINRIAGKTDLQITAGEAGFSEEVLEKVQTGESSSGRGTSHRGDRPVAASRRGRLDGPRGRHDRRPITS